uniref:Uncharacterized protein n=1 Tax=Prolemur simus TaxID=1328070 RepID=A0A8C8Z8P9_PROSS
FQNSAWYVRKCPANNYIIGAKDHVFIQMIVAAVDKPTGSFNGQFKTCAISVGYPHDRGPDSTISKRTSDMRELWMWNIYH